MALATTGTAAVPASRVADAGRSTTRAVRSRVPLVMAGLAVALLAAIVGAIALGSVPIPIGDVVRVLVGVHTDNPAYDTIVWSVRLPRTVTAGFAGAALGLAGLQMQTLFRNPLADPSILGVTAGAGLGVAFVVLAADATGIGLLSSLGRVGSLGMVGAGALGAAIVLILVLLIAERVPSRVTVLIVGVMVGYIASAVVSVLVSFSSLESIRNYSAWGQGSFRGTTWEQLRVLVPIVVLGLVAVRMLAKPMDALLMGDRYAMSMGVDVRRVRMLTIATSALLAGSVTAFCGPIAFLGIAVPHLARLLLRRSSHRELIPAVVMMGATLALVCEVVAQLPGSDRVLPLNAITALIGAPVVILILLRRGSKREQTT